MCLYPTLIKNKKYTANKKNGGNAPDIKDMRTLAVPIKCGKCMECVKAKAREWQVRLSEEIRHKKNGRFVTLTFSNASIKKLYKELQEYSGYELDNKIATLAVRRFTERWRFKYKKTVRHWLVTELGHEGTENIHLHGIIWTDEKPEEINRIWEYGFTWGTITGNENYVSEKTINYITKYITKQDAQHKEYKSKILSSKGIGCGYMERKDATNNKYEEGKTKETYKTRNGTKINLPIYYRNKLYTEEEKEKLWIEKLNKNERWVMGEKINIEKGEEQYYKALRYYRKKAKRLGYQNNETNWEQKEYEEQRRKFNLEKRIQDE